MKIIKKLVFLFKLHLFKLLGKELKLIVGGGKTNYSGWLYSDIFYLDITSIKDWGKYFQENTISNILAEHVWEHLTKSQSNLGLKFCYKFLSKNGKLRIAVPDGFFPSSDYIEYVRPGGSGVGASDHKILYNYKTLSAEFRRAGFKIKLIEHFDEKGKFHKTKWSDEDGIVLRSYSRDRRNKNKLTYTSLIVDGIK